MASVHCHKPATIDQTSQQKCQPNHSSTHKETEHRGLHSLTQCFGMSRPHAQPYTNRHDHGHRAHSCHAKTETHKVQQGHCNQAVAKPQQGQFVTTTHTTAVVSTQAQGHVAEPQQCHPNGLQTQTQIHTAGHKNGSSTQAQNHTCKEKSKKGEHKEKNLFRRIKERVSGNSSGSSDSESDSDTEGCRKKKEKNNCK